MNSNMGRKVLDINFVKNEIEKESYFLLTNNFDTDSNIRNSRKNLIVVCSNNHKFITNWSNWQKGRRCRKCYFNKIRLDISHIKNDFKKYGYKLKTIDYKNAWQKLNYVCPNGHEHNITWGHWSSGKRCPYCAKNIKLSIEFVRKEFEKEGYKLLSKEYINSQQKLNYICPNGHRCSITWNNWQQGKKCVFCNDRNISIWEKRVKKFISDDLNVNYIPNDRTQIINPNTNRYLELDIWFPQLNKAIECNGVYWHRKRRFIDKIKLQLCARLGIDLFILTDKEWNDDEKKCKDNLKNFLNNLTL